MKKQIWIISLFVLVISAILFGQSATMKKVGEYGYSYEGNSLTNISCDNNGDFIAVGRRLKYYGSEIFISKHHSKNGEQLWSEIFYYHDEKNIWQMILQLIIRMIYIL